jgi:hypothetical protein
MPAGKPLQLQANWSCLHPVENRTCRRQVKAMHFPKLYHCSVCSAEIPDLPMIVLRHQLFHVERRSFAADRLLDLDQDEGQQPEAD